MVRTTLTLDDDVLDMAKSLADARKVSIGKALSELARRGVNAPAPTSIRNGLRVFKVPHGSATFGPDEIQAAMDADDAATAKGFVS